MILPIPSLRSLVLPLFAAVALAAGDAGAQLEFRGVPWGASHDQAMERIGTAGYTFRGVDQDGDLVFGAADSVDLVAKFDDAGLVAVESTWLRDPDRLPARYQRLADSVRAVLGAPDSVSADEGEEVAERFVQWNRDGAALEMQYRPRGGGLDTAVFVAHHGPGWAAEYDRRWNLDEGPRDTTAVGDYHQAFGGFRVLIRVDTVKFERLEPAAYHVRFLHDWMQTRRLPNGMMYSSVLTELELDCVDFRSRPIRLTYLYNSPAGVFFIRQSRREWAIPTPESPDGIALRSACEALSRQR